MLKINNTYFLATVSPVGEGPDGIIDSTITDLTYTIRFQNTGNGPAVNIIIKDTLSPNVDINTFEMVHASHNYNIEILQGNVLRWKFNNIMLADSGSNEPASHGFIQYRIKRNNNNTPGTQIKNTAYIYFDFNEPVVTNTAINTIGTINGIKSIDENIELINVYPNPASNEVTAVISINDTRQAKIMIYNLLGEIVKEKNLKNGESKIDVSELKSGTYLYTIIVDNTKVKNDKLIIIK